MEELSWHIRKNLDSDIGYGIESLQQSRIYPNDDSLMTISEALSEIFSHRLHPRYNGDYQRWKDNEMGHARALRILEEFDYKVEVVVTRPAQHSPKLHYDPGKPKTMRAFRKTKTRTPPEEKP